MRLREWAEKLRMAVYGKRLEAPVKDVAELDQSGYIVADETGKTSAKGFFAAGDVRTKPLRQIVTAAADGANAAVSAEQYLLEMG